MVEINDGFEVELDWIGNINELMEERGAVNDSPVGGV